MYRWQLIPLAWLAAGFIATLAVLVLWRRRSAMADPRQALQKDLLRGPGESQRDRISEAAWDAAEYAALAVFLPPLAFCVFPLQAVQEGGLPGWPAVAAFAAAALALLAWVLARLWRVLSRARNLSLGYEAGVATGQELDSLRHLGYCVFHDVPVAAMDSGAADKDGATIPHVVVGPGGVFAVATVGRVGSRNGNGEPTEVTYDGERLQFPGWEETLPLGQAMAQAEWLAGWLANALNEPVAVRAILVLPGWSVKRTAVSGIPVLAARRINAYFGRMRALPEMTDTMIERIADQLDRHCRVIAVVAPEPPATSAQGDENRAREALSA
jgi:hypothetical protein